MKKIIALFILAFLFTFVADVAEANLGDDLSSPLTTEARTPLLVGSALTTVFFIFQSSLDNPLTRHVADNKPLGGASKWGDYYGQVIPNGAYALGMLVSGATGRKESYKNAEIMALGTIYPSVITQVLKFSVNEPRPNGSKHGFPSGHSTTAFAFASVVAAEHSLYYGIPAYAMAAFTGFSRMNDNKHYLREVLGGATLGTAYGLGIHFLRRGSSNISAKAEPNWHFFAAPSEAWDGANILARLEF